ncbi:exocyst complex component 3-like protein 2 isoform X2 [Pseudophryne corroboree]|uniref:exocyst complex component 3-like protein 2 isoform X2 n=1 Tax=Pseudophryne corroboree TaxID=495146 RepID=UPI0030817A9C
MPVTAPNPFDEDTPLDRPSPEGGNPFQEDEGEGKRDPMGSDAKRRGTLEKIAGLSPFWKGGKSLLGVRGAPEKRRGRRKSEDEEAREGPPGTKNMRANWVKAVGRSVEQRLKSNLEGKMGSLPSQATRVKRVVLEDLTTIKNYLVCSYPRDFEVFRIYHSAYHRRISDWLSAAAQRNLETNDIYFILDWNSNIYCRDVLSRPEISSLINPSDLEPLLSSETRKMLEQQYVSLVQQRASQRLEEELKLEQERWKQEFKNDDLSNFSGRVIQIMKPHVDRAPLINEEFGMMMADTCLSCFSDFLHSFHKTVEQFYSEQNGLADTTDAFICRVINIVNCCPTFREFASRMAQLAKTHGAELLHESEGSLDGITGLGTQGMCDLVLHDMKPFSRKVLGRRWLNSSDACDGMTSILADSSNALRKLSQGPYQATVSELHRKVMLELVRPLIQGKLSCTATKTRRKVASKLREESRQLGQMFSKLESPQSTLEQVIPRLTEILTLEDTASIQMEVAMLVSDFPDFRKRHLSSLLDVRGLWDPSARQQILGVLHDLESADCLLPCRGTPGFFSDIAITRDTHCINVSFSRASQFGRRTLSHLSRRGRVTTSQTGSVLRPGEEDTQL